MLLVAEAELEMLGRTVLTEPQTLNCDSVRESEKQMLRIVD